MQATKKIMKAYGVKPLKITPISNRVCKVWDGRYTYALKESRLTKSAIASWEQIYHHAHAFHLTTILPVYLTGQSNFYAEMDDKYYYLTPWIAEDQPNHEQKIVNAYEVIGSIHAKTSQQITVDIETAGNIFRNYRDNCAQLKLKLFNYVQLFEQNRFMSPFELQVCTHYHVLVSVLNELDFHIDRFMKELENDPIWYNCLCHGNLKLTHFLNTRHTYLINWESARYGTAVTDLSQLLHSQARFYDQSPEQLAELFSAYSDINALTDSQHHLLSIYLLDPFYYISLIDNYLEQPDHPSMLKRTRMLESAFRQLVLGLKWNNLVKDTQDFEESVEDSNS
ncbi:phosphotransferase [Lentibacillus amyloliquefaciens]|uniref:Aminoglycoside phosphotransferase domain-containing protein n=1 Tax=Lentibacillus amyloliquefaciens TaxID=1472767 RepID=A0A0U4DS97_9BACI|nr:phosphotransferase [Lentibacillus amyloliquefaciens]ALX48216.1 hypothetical protein AOX59_06100 [Lentibacillus amyloliquefaciens]